MTLWIGITLLVAFVLSIAKETRTYTPRTRAADFDDYIAHLHSAYGRYGFIARVTLLILAETAFITQLMPR